MSRSPFTDEQLSLRKGCSSPYNHHWEDHESKRNPKGGGWYMTLRCVKCGTVAKQIINRDGSIETNRNYDYPPGYLEGSKGMTRAEFRVSYLKSL